jgi:hypothetical protein
MIGVRIQQLAAGLENARIRGTQQFFRVHDLHHRIFLRERSDVTLRAAKALLGVGASQM